MKTKYNGKGKREQTTAISSDTLTASIEGLKIYLCKHFEINTFSLVEMLQTHNLSWEHKSFRKTCLDECHIKGFSTLVHLPCIQHGIYGQTYSHGTQLANCFEYSSSAIISLISEMNGVKWRWTKTHILLHIVVFSLLFFWCGAMTTILIKVSPMLLHIWLVGNDVPLFWSFK